MYLKFLVKHLICTTNSSTHIPFTQAPQEQNISRANIHHAYYTFSPQVEFIPQVCGKLPTSTASGWAPHVTPMRVNGGRSSSPVTAGVQSLHYAGRPGEAIGRLLPLDQHHIPCCGLEISSGRSMIEVS